MREGLSRYRIGEAIGLYERGEIDLRAAACHDGVSMHQMMTELQHHEITAPETEEKFFSGLQTLVAETFGGSAALHETTAQYRTSEEHASVWRVRIQRNGSRALTRVPPSGRRSIRQIPPSSSARSRIEATPTPGW